MKKLLAQSFYRFVWLMLLAMFFGFFLWQYRGEYISWNALYFVTMILLLSFVLVGFLYLIEEARVSIMQKEVHLSGGALLIALVTMLCPVCNIGIFASLGIALQLHFLTPYISYLAGATLILLGYTLYLLDKRIREGCSSCRIS